MPRDHAAPVGFEDVTEMSRVTSSAGPLWPNFGKCMGWLAGAILQYRFHIYNVFQIQNPPSQRILAKVRQKIANGEEAFIVGLGAAGHNAGVGLARITPQKGLELLGNDEEERFTGIKHYGGFPEQSLRSLERRLANIGKTPADVDAWCLTWDYIALAQNASKSLMEQMPFSWRNVTREAMPKLPFLWVQAAARSAPGKVQDLFGLKDKPTMISMLHHGNHAAFSYAVSPFAKDGKPTLVLVLDGMGDSGAISVYRGDQSGITRLYTNDSFTDSLGLFYSVVSSTKGGWTTLSSEGRYMGAAAWGDSNRLTNRYYRQLREMFHFGPKGEAFINRQMANWQNAGEIIPYNKPLEEIIGPPITKDRMWNPDAILNVDDVEHAEITRDRVDLAAATQLVFEDVLFHLIDYYVRTTGIDRLVMTGGTALNCVANMRLLECYNRDWFQRNLGREAQLQLWVPPIPGDAGVTIGAAYQFAMLAGAKSGATLDHAFYCGLAPSSEEIATALTDEGEIESLDLGNINDPAVLAQIADLMAFIMSQNGVLGIFQGSAETGPRALGHRSILANPCNPLSLQIINERVKFRERVRPLAPMVTREAAEKYWELSPGAAANDYSAYNYMVLTVPARPLGYEQVPAVIHFDGTSRIQIVRPESDPLIHAYLRAMGRRVGAEVSVNTSLNVGSPIAQTPQQAIVAMKRAKSLSGLIMVGADGQTRLAWHALVAPPKDGGEQLQGWLNAWRAETAAPAGSAR